MIRSFGNRAVLVGAFSLEVCSATMVSAHGQANPPPPISASPTAPAAAPETPQADCGCVVIPPLTVVSIELLETVGSKINKTGDKFAIRLAQPIAIDGKVVVAAGVTGMGEVVHAKKSGGSGAGGELVLAARYLDVGSKRLRLRSMQVSAVGQDQMTLALAASEAIGPFAFAVRGKNTEIAKGRVASAKTAEAFELPIGENSEPATTPVQ